MAVHAESRQRAGWTEVVQRTGTLVRRSARRAVGKQDAPVPAGYVTAAEAAAALGLRVRDLVICVEDGYLASRAVGRERFVAVSDLADYMDRHPHMAAGFRPELLERT